MSPRISSYNMENIYSLGFILRSSKGFNCHDAKKLKI